MQYCMLLQLLSVPFMVVSSHWTGILEWTTGLTFFLVLHIFKLLYIWVTCDSISALSGEYDTKCSQMGSVKCTA